MNEHTAQPSTRRQTRMQRVQCHATDSFTQILVRAAESITHTPRGAAIKKKFGHRKRNVFWANALFFLAFFYFFIFFLLRCSGNATGSLPDSLTG